ncbi:intraflagellar transport protein 20 homolog [Hippoglossus stenolepis]|uniref:intraflagellar transport protein 20 homolog n=1 Tax=Hippoglossus stenolepis TaxID=195615 RepID=UPI001FAFDA1F|nr:intraflagellar transport protein 20 homolog [Hippoglossus stenolepis]
MAKDPLAEAGIYFDELKNLTALEPDVSQKTSELQEGSKDFVDKIEQFQKIAARSIRLIDELAKEVEKQKRKAIAARNLQKLMARLRGVQQQQQQALIAEKKSQLERYRIEAEALSKVESEQNKLINQFI